MNKRRLLFVGNYFISDKTNLNIWHVLVNHLRSNGWEVLTTSPRISRLHRLVDMLWIIYSRRKQYLVAEVDAFSGLSFVWAVLSTLLLNILGKKVVLTLHGGNLPALSKKHPFILKKILNTADLVVAPSMYLKDTLHEFRTDILVINNPVDLDLYPFQNRDNPKPTLIWVRAFHEIYNPSLVVDLLSLLKRKYPNIRLTMLGPDKGDGSLQRMMKKAEHLVVLDSIELIGGVPHQKVHHYLQGADIFINTTNVDNAPLSVIEAMACGLCVVSTNVGGIPYLLENEVDALLVPPNNPEAMAGAICRILENPNFARQLSKNAHKKVEGFDWSIVLPQWETLFETLIRNE